MGQILIRNLDDDVIARLKARARSQSTSLEQTVRQILTEEAKPSRRDLVEEARRIRERIGPVSEDSTDLIRRDRDTR